MKIVEYKKNWEHAKYLWIKQNFLGASVKILLTILQLNFIIFEQPKINIIRIYWKILYPPIHGNDQTKRAI